MIIKHVLIMFFTLIITTSCITNSVTREPINLSDRTLIYNELSKKKIINSGRKLVHLVHLCNLIIDNEFYPVIDMLEHVEGAQVPRGVPHILVLNSSLELKNKIYYDGITRPLYCKNNKLFLFGFLTIDGLDPEGNVLSFSDAGKSVIVSEMETNDFPQQIPPQ